MCCRFHEMFLPPILLVGFVTPIIATAASAAAQSPTPASPVMPAASPQQATQGKKEDTPTLSDSDRFAFRDALAQIAAKNHVAFVVEGEPHKIVLLERKLAANQAAEAAVLPPTSLQEQVDRVAASYDYTAKKSGSIYLFRKQYTYPQDTPCVTPEECAISAEQMRDAMKAVKDASLQHSSQSVGAIASSLTSAQLAQLRQLHYLRLHNDLTPEQLQGAHGYFMSHFFSSFSDGVYYIIEDLRDFSHTRFSVEKNKTGYIVDWSPGSPIPYDFTPFSNPQDYVTMVNGKVVEDPDLSGIAHQAEVPTPELAHITISLAQAVARLNTQNNAKRTPKEKEKVVRDFAVEPALSEKPVTLIGEENAAPFDIAQAITDLYDLRLLRAPDTPNVERIALRPAPTKIETPTDLAEAAHRLLPAPLRQAFKVDEEDAVYNLGTYNTPRSKEELTIMNRKWDRDAAIQTHRERVIQSMERQLLAILNPKLALLPAQADGKPGVIPLRSLDPNTQAIFATLACKGYTRNKQMDHLMHPPYYVMHMDDMALVFRHTTMDQPGTGSLAFSMFDNENQKLGMPVIGTGMPLSEIPDGAVAP